MVVVVVDGIGADALPKPVCTEEYLGFREGAFRRSRGGERLKVERRAEGSRSDSQLGVNEGWRLGCSPKERRGGG